MFRKVDLPPVWLAIMIALAWIQARNLPLGSFGDGWADLLGGLLVGGGIVLTALAILAMRQAKTTIVPHRDPEAFVTTGIFARTRNPIYLGDAMILGGLILYWDAVPSLVLVPLFVWLITDRFILGEEERLRDGFGPLFDDYCQRVRRWV